MAEEPGRPDPAEGDEGDVGSVADEAARLLAALGDWARDQGPGLGAGLGAGVAAAAGVAADAARQVGEHVGTQRPAEATEERPDTPHPDEHPHGGDPACTWCPICRALDAVRSMSPEVRAQLGVAATALLQAGAGLLAGLGAEPMTGQRDQGPTGSGVGRIDPLDDDPPDGDLPDGVRRPGDDDRDREA